MVWVNAHQNRDVSKEWPESRKYLLLKCSFEVETVRDVVNYNNEGVSPKKTYLL